MSAYPKVQPHVAAARMRALPWLPRVTLTAGGLGYAKWAPGTWGSMPTCVLWGLLLASGWPDWVVIALFAVHCAWAGLMCVWYGAAAERAVGAKDPNCVVADEVAGMGVALVGVHEWWAIGVAFLLFRFFDVVKPPPCRQFQAVRGGWGILLDDLFAGIYAAIAVHLLLAVV